jgi:hypothetical protein
MASASAMGREKKAPGLPLLLIIEGDDAGHQHDAHFEGGGVDGESADDAEQQDAGIRISRGTRRMRRATLMHSMLYDSLDVAGAEFV